MGYYPLRIHGTKIYRSMNGWFLWDQWIGQYTVRPKRIRNGLCLWIFHAHPQFFTPHGWMVLWCENPWETWGVWCEHWEMDWTTSWTQKCWLLLRFHSVDAMEGCFFGREWSIKKGGCSNSGSEHWLQLRQMLLKGLRFILVFRKIGIPQNGWFIMENPI